MEEKYCELLYKTLVEIDTIDGEIDFNSVTVRQSEWFLQMMTLRDTAQKYLNGRTT